VTKTWADLVLQILLARRFLFRGGGGVGARGQFLAKELAVDWSKENQNPEELTVFKSPVRILARSFQRSRDNWKRKHQDLKRQMKRLQVQVYDVRQSREQWRQRAEEQELRVQQLEEAIARLRRQLDSVQEDGGKKN
jgi:chromosome segregation ATPase